MKIEEQVGEPDGGCEVVEDVTEAETDLEPKSDRIVASHGCRKCCCCCFLLFEQLPKNDQAQDFNQKYSPLRCYFQLQLKNVPNLPKKIRL